MTTFILRGEIDQTINAATSDDTWRIVEDAVVAPEGSLGEGAVGVFSPDGADGQTFVIQGRIDVFLEALKIGAGDWANPRATSVNLLDTGEVASEDEPAIRSVRDNFRLTNTGHIVGYQGVNLSGDGWRVDNRGLIESDPAAFDVGVVARGSNYGLTNGGTGVIDGLIGMTVLGLDGRVGNFGAIGTAASSDGMVIGGAPGEATTGFFLANFGVIEGRFAGILLRSNADENAIRNEGVIRAAEGPTIHGDGVSEGSIFRIVNGVNGVIEGGLLADEEFVSAMQFDAGRQFVRNSGLIEGNVELGAEDDVFVQDHAGDVTGSVRGGDGDDQITMNGSDDVLSGEAGGDVLRAGAGDDRIFGGAGDDFIFDGAGSDEMHGGEGVDRFVYEGADASAIDRIIDFENDVDILNLAGAGLSGRGSALLRMSTDLDGDTTLTLDNGAQLVIEGISAADLYDDLLV